MDLMTIIIVIKSKYYQNQSEYDWDLDICLGDESFFSEKKEAIDEKIAEERQTQKYLIISKNRDIFHKSIITYSHLEIGL